MILADQCCPLIVRGALLIAHRSRMMAAVWSRTNSGKGEMNARECDQGEDAPGRGGDRAVHPDAVADGDGTDGVRRDGFRHHRLRARLHRLRGCLPDGPRRRGARHDRHRPLPGARPAVHPALPRSRRAGPACAADQHEGGGGGLRAGVPLPAARLAGQRLPARQRLRPERHEHVRRDAASQSRSAHHRPHREPARRR